MFTRLIVGIDGLDGGKDALALARDLTRDDGDGELVLVNAYPTELLASRAAVLDYEAVVRADAERMLAEAAPADITCTTSVLGDAFAGRALHHVAAERGADLIVIGSCHRGTVGRALIGDVSRSALHEAPCPVAVAPRDYRLHGRPPRVIGVGFDAAVESRAALDVAAEISRSTGAELRVLTAARIPPPFVPGYAAHFDVPDVRERHRVDAQHALDDAIAALAVPASGELVDGTPGGVLTELSHHVDLMVVGSRGWGSARRVVLGSTADHIVHHAACPVIVVPRPAPSEPEAASRPEATHA